MDSLHKNENPVIKCSPTSTFQTHKTVIRLQNTNEDILMKLLKLKILMPPLKIHSPKTFKWWNNEDI